MIFLIQRSSKVSKKSFLVLKNTRFYNFHKSPSNNFLDWNKHYCSLDITIWLLYDFYLNSLYN